MKLNGKEMTWEELSEKEINLSFFKKIFKKKTKKNCKQSSSDLFINSKNYIRPEETSGCKQSPSELINNVEKEYVNYYKYNYFKKKNNEEFLKLNKDYKAPSKPVRKPNKVVTESKIKSYKKIAYFG